MTSIQQEIKQSIPFPSKSLEAGVALLRTASMLRRSLEAEMNRFGITHQQYNVLRILRGAGEAMPTMEIADRMIEHEPGITRLLGRLEKKGLIKRHRCNEDGRRVLTEITKAGKGVLEQSSKPGDDTFNKGMEALSESELDELLHLLSKTRALIS